METHYGIFLTIGAPLNYGKLKGTPLTKLNTKDDFKSIEDAIKFIEDESFIEGGVEYLILPYLKYRKNNIY